MNVLPVRARPVPTAVQYPMRSAIEAAADFMLLVQANSAVV